MRCQTILAVPLLAATVARAGDWITFVDETATRLVADPAVGTSDPAEKDYAWDDVDKDGDIDLVVVRKQPFTTSGGRRNVLFMNEDGVLTDLTAQYIGGFLELTNDRDVVLVDVNGDTWPDIVTAANCNGCDSVTIVDDSRLYLNLGDDGNGNWLGYGPATVLLDEGNQNAVAAGDLTGDGFPDLYFVSANDDFEDQLLINGGPKNPGVFTVDNDRLTAAMRSSSLGTNTAIADFNNDSWNDIVKVEMHSTEILYNDGGGFFTILYSFPIYSETEVSVGDLNGDGLPDLVVTEEVTDRYFLNQGNGGDGLAEFDILFFPSSTIGFGGASVIADLDGDNFNDVVIASTDIDLPGCSWVADILRNSGDAPDVTFTPERANLSNDDLSGVYDFAVFDIDGDGAPDLIAGRCDGTTIWINAPRLGACPWDLDGSGDVGINDFLDLLALWGTDPGGPPDFDGNGDVGITDFLALLANWGPCP